MSKDFPETPYLRFLASRRRFAALIQAHPTPRDLASEIALSSRRDRRSLAPLPQHSETHRG